LHYLTFPYNFMHFCEAVGLLCWQLYACAKFADTNDSADNRDYFCCSKKYEHLTV